MRHIQCLSGFPAVQLPVAVVVIDFRKIDRQLHGLAPGIQPAFGTG